MDVGYACSSPQHGAWPDHVWLVLTFSCVGQNSSGAVVPHLGGANISEFKFLAGWVSTDQPVGLLAGGTILSVIAFGLDVAAAHQCVFTGTSSLLRRNVTAAATSVSSTKLVCVAPDWPAWPTPAEASVTVYAAGRILPLVLSPPPATLPVLRPTILAPHAPDPACLVFRASRVLRSRLISGERSGMLPVETTRSSCHHARAGGGGRRADTFHG